MTELSRLLAAWRESRKETSGTVTPEPRYDAVFYQGMAALFGPEVDMNPIDQVHHDGLGLNDRITIEADARDPNAGGASHFYTAFIDTGAQVNPGNPEESHSQVLTIQFQRGPRTLPDSTPGVTEAVVLAVLIDRMKAFQEGPFACRENALVLTKLEEAHQWLGHRARERNRRGVLGKNEK